MCETSHCSSNNGSVESINSGCATVDCDQNKVIGARIIATDICDEKLVAGASAKSSDCIKNEPNFRKNHSGDHRKSWVLPLFHVPINKPGVMWTGNFRRTPVITFSQSCILVKCDAAEKLGRCYNMSYRLVRMESKLIRNILSAHGFQESANQFGKFNVLWTGGHLRPTQLRILSDFHKINHFPRSYEITRKDRLAKNVHRMQRLKGLHQFDILPPSFILPEEFHELCSAYAQDKVPYIVKPMASSRGRGIFLISHPEEIPCDEPVVVSRYISNPFLLDGFKFDVRIYAAVTSYEPLVLYVYEEGLVRFATVRYQPGFKHLRSQCMHLTNYSVNKKNFEFVHNDDANVEDYGNKWSLGALLRYLRSEGADVTGLMLRIEDVIVKSFLSVLSPIVATCNLFPACQSKCFELYGFDIIVDDNFRPWLLEVNLSPSLACDTPLDFKVKSHMLTDLFNLVGLVCHDPSRKTQGGVNSLHMTAKGEAAVPPPMPTCFQTAEEYLRMYSKDNAGRKESTKPWAFLSRQASSLSSSVSQVDPQSNGWPGTVISHLIPDGMTSDEVDLMRRLQEEAARAGGWLRLVPNVGAWEQYASLWPTGEPHFSGDKRMSGSCCSINSSASLSFTRHDQELNGDKRRTGSYSIVSSAYSAAFAVFTLNNIVQYIAEQQAGDKAHDIHLEPETLPQLHQPDASNGIEFHPNSSVIEVDLETYLRSVNGKDPKQCLNRNFVTTVRTPNAASVSRSKPSLHNMSHGRLQQYLNNAVKMSTKLNSLDDQCQHVIFCYTQTLGRMPFFLRKLGEPPCRIPGVYLEQRKRDLSVTGPGLTTRKPTHNQQAGNVREPVKNAATVNVPVSPSTTTLVKSSKKPSRQKGTRNCQNSVNADCATKHKTENLLKLSASELSALEARQAFSVYLSRIKERLSRECEDASIGVSTQKCSSRNKIREVDILMRFVRRASRMLSNKAIRTSLGDSGGELLTPEMGGSEHCLLETHQIKRKRELVNLLEKFIGAYRCETLMLTFPHSQGRDLPTDMNLNRREIFRQFLDEATESQLEELLVTYAELSKSIRVLLGDIPSRSKHTSTVKSELEGSNKTDCTATNVSSDSGFGSLADGCIRSDSIRDVGISKAESSSSKTRMSEISCLEGERPKKPALEHSISFQQESCPNSETARQNSGFSSQLSPECRKAPTDSDESQSSVNFCCIGLARKNKNAIIKENKTDGNPAKSYNRQDYQDPTERYSCTFDAVQKTENACQTPGGGIVPRASRKRSRGRLLRTTAKPPNRLNQPLVFSTRLAPSKIVVHRNANHPRTARMKVFRKPCRMHGINSYKLYQTPSGHNSCNHNSDELESILHNTMTLLHPASRPGPTSVQNWPIRSEQCQSIASTLRTPASTANCLSVPKLRNTSSFHAQKMCPAEEYATFLHSVNEQNNTNASVYTCVQHRRTNETKISYRTKNQPRMICCNSARQIHPLF
ncbi:hypothetical protein CRM22_010230 [Opisthorchis felineus]|uniref:Tubulin--tyrosine ligase-like protein 5 n=1 Tax=Opisthorchis felineus TaxID=147828 RepID=A0A4S2L060_OPIFE|nr:hypothetical protein CRM22_010230 [Opisthorchis felineus]